MLKVCFNSSSGELKVWEPNEEKRELEEIASTSIDCRPTSLGLLDLSQFGNARPQEQRIKVEAKPKGQAGGSEAAKPEAPRGFVTIEYEQDEQQETKVEATPKSTNKPKQKKQKQPAPQESSEETDSEEEEDDSDDFSEDSDASSAEETRKRRPQKRKQPNASFSSKRKQTKKK